MVVAVADDHPGIDAQEYEVPRADGGGPPSGTGSGDATPETHHCDDTGAIPSE